MPNLLDRQSRRSGQPHGIAVQFGAGMSTLRRHLSQKTHWARSQDGGQRYGTATPVVKRTAAASSMSGCFCTQADPLRFLEGHRVPLKSVPVSSGLSEWVLNISRLPASTHLITPQSVSESTETGRRPDCRSGEILFANGGSEGAVLSAEPPQLGQRISQGCEQEYLPRNGASPQGWRAWGVFRLRARKHLRKYPQVELIANVRVR